MTETSKQWSVEIRVAANGYLVLPGYEYNRDPGTAFSGENVHVFETFEALVLWLKNNLGELKE